MRKLIVALALALTVVSGQGGIANATPVGNSYFIGLSGPGELADLIEASNRIDPSGRRKLSEERCRRNGSCANAQNYLASYQRLDPTANLRTVQDLPAYLRRATVRAGVPGTRYWADCLQPVRGGGWRDRGRCLHRLLRPGENLWISYTGVPIGLSHCANPGGTPAQPPREPDCVWTEVWVERGRRDHADDDSLGIYLTGPRPLEDGECSIEVHVDNGTGTEVDGFLRECVDNCEITEAIREYGMPPTQWSVRYATNPEMTGRVRVRVRHPRSLTQAGSVYRLWFCLTRVNGTQTQAIGVEPHQYRRVNGVTIATVYYSAQEASRPYPNGPDVYWQWQPWRGRW